MIGPIFEARYRGTCDGCRQHDISPGDLVYFNGNKIIRIACCVDDVGDDEETVSMGAGFDSFNLGRSPEIKVMPYGKTKRDMCMKCFQIPANSGVCGCYG